MLSEHADIYQDSRAVLGRSIVSFVRAAADVTSDGLVTPDETQLLAALGETVEQAIATADAHWTPLPVGISNVDNVVRLIGAAAGAGAVTPHVLRVARESAADAAYLAEAA